MGPSVNGLVVFHSPIEHQASAAIHGLWDRPPADLVLEARANGGYGNDVHDSCAEFLGWLLNQRPRPGSFCVFSLPGVEWNEEASEHERWYSHVMGVLAAQQPPPVLVNMDDFSVTQGERVIWAPSVGRRAGLVCAIAQDADSGKVLMVAWMNEEAFRETVRTRRAVYFSRSRNKLWRKGEESGHVQEVRSIAIDCDADAVLLKVQQVGGAACHEGYESCFFRELTGEEEMRVVGERVFDPKAVYSK